jgi:putative intracellular protease/amidase
MKRIKLNLSLTIVIIAVLAITASAQTTTPAKSAKPPRNLAILIFDGVQIIDYTGPYETFGHTYSNDGQAFNIYTVSEKTNAITTSMGMSVNPKFSFENAPKPDVLLVPGGDVRGQLDSPTVIKWIQGSANNAEIVMSVCNGAFILAKAGLLDGMEATTTAGLIPLLRQEAPKVKVVDDRRFVDNGHIITTAGLSSGIDGALHVIERLYGRGTAQMAALGMEYNWDPDSRFVRAMLADKYLRFNYDVKVAEGGWRPLSRSGSVDKWENTWAVTTVSTANELLDAVNNAIASNRTYGPPLAKWTRVNADSTRNPLQTWWTFSDEKGGSWNGVVNVSPVAGQKNQYTLSVKVERKSAGSSQSSM